MFRDSPKACFSDFPSFGTPESLFFRFLELRDPPTAHFPRKQLVGVSRNIAFLNFGLSGYPEALFFRFPRFPMSGRADDTFF